MLCDSSNLHKQKLVKPKPLASNMAAVKKVGQKNGVVGLLVEYLFCGIGPRTYGNVFLRFCIVSSNEAELVVLDSLENSKQCKNAGKRFRVYGALVRVN